MRRLTTVMVVACCAVGVGACGDDDEDGGGPVATGGEQTATAPAPTGSTPVVTSPPEDDVALSEQELVQQASAICDKADDASNEIDEPANFRTDPAAAADFLGKLEKLAQEQLAGLRALTPPASLQADYATLVAKEQQATDLVSGVLAKARTGDPSGLRDLEGLSEIGDDIEAAAKKAGIEDC